MGFMTSFRVNTIWHSLGSLKELFFYCILAIRPLKQFIYLFFYSTYPYQAISFFVGAKALTLWVDGAETTPFGLTIDHDLWIGNWWILHIFLGFLFLFRVSELLLHSSLITVGWDNFSAALKLRWIIQKLFEVCLVWLIEDINR